MGLMIQHNFHEILLTTRGGLEMYPYLNMHPCLVHLLSTNTLPYKNIAFLGFLFCAGYVHCHLFTFISFSFDIWCLIFQSMRNIGWFYLALLRGTGSNFHMLKEWHFIFVFIYGCTCYIPYTGLISCEQLHSLFLVRKQQWCHQKYLLVPVFHAAGTNF